MGSQVKTIYAIFLNITAALLFAYLAIFNVLANEKTMQCDVITATHGMPKSFLLAKAEKSLLIRLLPNQNWLMGEFKKNRETQPIEFDRSLFCQFCWGVWKIEESHDGVTMTATNAQDFRRKGAKGDYRCVATNQRFELQENLASSSKVFWFGLLNSEPLIILGDGIIRNGARVPISRLLDKEKCTFGYPAFGESSYKGLGDLISPEWRRSRPDIDHANCLSLRRQFVKNNAIRQSSLSFEEFASATHVSSGLVSELVVLRDSPSHWPKRNKASSVSIERQSSVSSVATTSSSLRSLSQTQLCYWATDPDGQGGKRWHTSIDRIEHVSEAQRRGLTCGVTEGVNNARPERLPQFSSYRRVTIRLGQENQDGVIGFNDRKNGNVWSGTGKVLVLGELCDVSTRFDISNRDSDFRVTCPSGYKAKGQYKPLGAGQGSVGIGADSYDNKVQYKLHPATGRFAINRSDFEEAVRSALDAGKPSSQGTVIARARPPEKPSTPVNIEITSVRVSGAQGHIQGFVSEGLAELLVDGETVSFDSAGKFSFKTYVPAGGKQIEVVAIDRQGGTIRRDVSLTRDGSSREARVTFDGLNPTNRRVESNRSAIALIVGVAEYEKTAGAEFADKDAQVFYDYAHLKLGIPQNRIQTLVNDKADEVGLLTGVNKWLKRSVKQGESDVYIFFAGHGLASDDGDTAYLIPYDGAPDFLERTAISRDEVFREVSSVNPRSVTVFLDTCYSGDTRGESRLIAGRPLGIKLQEQSLPAGFTVLTAAGGDQIAKPLKEAQHGMFSYFLMKGMEGDADSDGDNEITARELHSYVRENVVQQSGGSQVPELQGDGEKVLVRFR